jgi:hypothetical protein
VIANEKGASLWSNENLLELDCSDANMFVKILKTSELHTLHG